MSGKIKDSLELEKAIKVIRNAIQLKNEQNYDDYFSNFDCENRQKRQEILQYLHHEFLDLSEFKFNASSGQKVKKNEFKDHCWNRYSVLAKTIPEIPKFLSSSRQRQQLRECSKHIFKMSQEMTKVTIAPFIDLPSMRDVPAIEPEKRETVNYTHDKYKTHFSNLKSHYESRWHCFWKSDDRKDQVRQLFNKLDEFKNTPEQEKSFYYHRSLDVICDTQQEILISDRNTKRNAKGYSRLYDICTQMFLTLARDCLADQKVFAQTKKHINTLLQQQLAFHINELETRLPGLYSRVKLGILNLKAVQLGVVLDENHLKYRNADPKQREQLYTNELQKLRAVEVRLGSDQLWLPGSKSLRDLKKLIETERKHLPKHLQYLVNNMDGLFTLVNSQSSDVKSEVDYVPKNAATR